MKESGLDKHDKLEKKQIGRPGLNTEGFSRISVKGLPRYFWMSSEPTTRRKVAAVSFATAFANSVLPVQLSGQARSKRGQ